MDSDEERTDTRVFMEHRYAIGGYDEERESQFFLLLRERGWF